MRDFAVEQGELQDEFLDAIHGKGAFRVFKSKLDRHGLIDQWHKFKQAALTQIALDWLESHNMRPDE